MKYQIFNEILESNVLLPELRKSTANFATIFFTSKQVSLLPDTKVKWFHDWQLPNGQVCISVGREADNFWMRFPNITDFLINPRKRNIYAFHLANIPDSHIRHLLLDQVIPRLMFQLGEQVIHASCIKMHDTAIAFCGESGWGKSTLGAFFHNMGYTIITDDCLMLRIEKTKVFGIPNYQGIRLCNDTSTIFSGLENSDKIMLDFGKKRLIINNGSKEDPLALAAIFILSDPYQNDQTSIGINPITGAAAAIELVKNSFCIDITDTKRMGKQLQALAMIAGKKSLSLYQLSYPRKFDLLPNLCNMIRKICMEKKQ